MILDALTEADRYAALGSDFVEAFRFLRRPDLASLPDGRMDLSGDRLYALVMRTIGVGREKARLETHRRYLDIQYVLAGADTMGWRSARDSLAGAGYNAVKDIEFHQAAPVSWLEVPADHFAVFFPMDAHAPLAGTGRAHKVVIKIRVA